MTNEGGVAPDREQDQPVFADVEQFASTIFDSPILGLAILDGQLRYLSVNKTLAAIHGIPAQEHVGKTVRHVLGDVSLIMEYALYRLTVAGDRLSAFELTATLPTRDGPGHFLMNFFSIKDTSGVIAQIVVSVFEVTRLRKFEQCLVDLTGPLPRIRDQIICLGLPNREESDKVQSWRGSIEMLGICVQKLRQLSNMLRTPATPPNPSQVSLPDFSLMTTKESSPPPSSSIRSRDKDAIELSPRLIETVRHLAEGKSNKEIAAALSISPRTVDHYREAIMLKLDFHSLTELVRYAVRKGLIIP
jgi:DNA-binding CsgD family transcriptional regulator